MEKLLDKWWIALLFLVVYYLFDVLDARWLIPHMRDRCNGALTAQEEEECFHWYYEKRTPK